MTNFQICSLTIFGGSKFTAVKMTWGWSLLSECSIFMRKPFDGRSSLGLRPSINPKDVDFGNPNCIAFIFMLHHWKETFRIWRFEDQWSFLLASVLSWSKNIHFFSSSVCTSFLNFRFSSLLYWHSYFADKTLLLTEVANKTSTVWCNNKLYCYESLFCKRYPF
jgi:hypothetical protein